MLQHRELVRVHGRCANVVHLAAPDQVMQRLHRLFKRGVRVETVDLQQIEVGCVQASEGGIDSFEDGRSRQATTVDVVFAQADGLTVCDAANARVLTYVAVAFAEDDQLVPGQLVLLDRFADDLLAYTVAVDVGLEADGQFRSRMRPYCWMDSQCPTC